MYASLWMLLRPFAAMNGCCAGENARSGLGVAVVPVNGARVEFCGSVGIGDGELPAVWAPAIPADPSAPASSAQQVNSVRRIPEPTLRKLFGSGRSSPRGAMAHIGRLRVVRIATLHEGDEEWTRSHSS